MSSVNKITLLLLTITLILGGIFRFYKLGTIPAGLYSDEAALGYNAYSILETGRDEYGMSFPVLFRSFETFQSPVYTYLSVPFVYLFGLNSFSVRLLSALLGFLTLPLLFLLVSKLVHSSKFLVPSSTINQEPRTNNYELPTIAALLLAISPWHILYSRTAYEANVALFFLILGLVVFLASFKKPFLLLFAGISFAISFLAYRAEVIIIPILIIPLLYLFFRNPDRRTKTNVFLTIVTIVLGLLITSPLLKLIPTAGFMARSAELNIAFNFKEFFSLYSSYFSPRYLFSIGDSGPRSSYPNFGTFFQWQLPLYLFGLYQLFKSKENSKLKIVILTLFFVSPIPAALTKDPYTTIRSLTMVIPLVVIVSYGLVEIINRFSFLKYKYLYLASCFMVLYSVSKIFLSIFYFNDYLRAKYWDYGWQQIATDIKNFDPKLPVIVDNLRGEPYIHLLFHLQYDPASFQKTNTKLDLSEYYTNLQRNRNVQIGNITFKPFQWGTDTDRVEKYLIVDSQAISQAQIDYHKLSIIDEIKLPDGTVVFRVLKTNPTQ